MQPRYGTRLFWDSKDSEEIDQDTNTLTLMFTNGSTYVKGQLDVTGLAQNGGHITFDKQPTVFGNANLILANKKFGIKVPADSTSDNKSFSFHLRTPATFSGTYNCFRSIFDVHTLAGTIVGSWYFQDNLIICDDVGEIVAINQKGEVTPLWYYSKFIQQSGADPHVNSGWRETSYANADVNKSTLIVGNGQDFPVIIDLNATVQCQYLVDPSTGSNAGIPKAALIKTNANYLTAVDPATAATVKISAKNTNSVFTGNADPDDAIS